MAVSAATDGSGHRHGDANATNAKEHGTQTAADESVNAREDGHAKRSCADRKTGDVVGTDDMRKHGSTKDDTTTETGQ